MAKKAGGRKAFCSLLRTVTSKLGKLASWQHRNNSVWLDLMGPWVVGVGKEASSRLLGPQKHT